MSDPTNRSRVQKGVPTGGQFASEARGEADIDLCGERSISGAGAARPLLDGQAHVTCYNGHKQAIQIPDDPGMEVPCPQCGQRLYADIDAYQASGVEGVDYEPATPSMSQEAIDDLSAEAAAWSDLQDRYEWMNNETVEHWAGNNFDPAHAAEWIEHGFDDPYRAYDWSEHFDADAAYGWAQFHVNHPEWNPNPFTPDEAKDWYDRGFDPGRAHEWRSSTSFTPNKAKQWHEAFSTKATRKGPIDPRVAQDFKNNGFDKWESADWYDQSFDPEDARDWRWTSRTVDGRTERREVWDDPADAAMWRDSGLGAREAIDWQPLRYGLDGVSPTRAAEWKRHGFTAQSSMKYRRQGIRPEDAVDMRDAD